MNSHKGLSAQQIAWARQHDWFVEAGRTEAGINVVQVREVLLNDEGKAGHEYHTFDDYVELRAWAGY